MNDVGIGERIILKCIFLYRLPKISSPWNTFCVFICVHGYVCVCVCVYTGVASCCAGSMLVKANRPRLVQRLQRAHRASYIERSVVCCTYSRLLDMSVRGYQRITFASFSCIGTLNLPPLAH